MSPRGLRHVALSISFLSPMARRPDASFAMNIASLILQPDLGFLALTFFPELQPPQFELWKLLPDFPAQAIFIAFSRALAPSGKHPNPIALSSYEKHPSTFRSHQFRGLRHSYKHHLSPMMFLVRLQRSAIIVTAASHYRSEMLPQTANRS
jgi:hypothetical protein